MARIEGFVGYTETGALVVSGDLRTGEGLKNSIHMRVRITELLFGSKLKLGSTIEVPLSRSGVNDLSSMQEYFTGTNTILFLVDTKGGFRSVNSFSVGTASRSEVKRILRSNTNK